MNNLKEQVLLLIAFVVPFFAKAQIDVGGLVDQQGKSIIKAFPIIAIVGLIAVFVWQIDNIFGKQGDWRKALGAFVAYAVLLGIVVLIAQYVRGISLV